jgi:riboflavin-specific deaminase-like protein
MGANAAVDKIWPLLLEASRHFASERAIWRGANSGIELTIEPGGTWSSRSRLDDSAAALIDALAPIIAARSIVVGQLGQSLDGRIATRTGHSQYINGPIALTHLHRLRALVDAVIVGAETACTDRPRLNVRHVEGRDPTCVVVDPRGRVPMQGPLFDSGDGRTVLHLVGPDARPADSPDHVERVAVSSGPDGIEPSALLAELQSRGLHRVLVEGGAHTISRFIDAGALDRLHLLIAPLIIGSGRIGLELSPIDRLDEARRPAMRSFALGDELLVDVHLNG